MTARQSYDITLAMRAVERGESIGDAAKRYGVHRRSLERALRRSGVPAKPVGRPVTKLDP